MKFWLSLVLFIFSTPLVLNAQNDMKAAKKRIDDLRDAMNKDFGSDWDSDKYERFIPGETVQIDKGIGTIEAEVIDQRDNGWVEIKYRMDGKEYTSSYPPQLGHAKGGKVEVGIQVRQNRPRQSENQDVDKSKICQGRRSA